MEFMYVRKFPKKKNIWIQQFYFGRKQKYQWKHFYTIKNLLKYRASKTLATLNLCYI